MIPNVTNGREALPLSFFASWGHHQKFRSSLLFWESLRTFGYQKVIFGLLFNPISDMLWSSYAVFPKHCLTLFLFALFSCRPRSHFDWGWRMAIGIVYFIAVRAYIGYSCLYIHYTENFYHNGFTFMLFT